MAWHGIQTKAKLHAKVKLNILNHMRANTQNTHCTKIVAKKQFFFCSYFRRQKQNSQVNTHTWSGRVVCCCEITCFVCNAYYVQFVCNEHGTTADSRHTESVKISLLDWLTDCLTRFSPRLLLPLASPHHVWCTKNQRIIFRQSVKVWVSIDTRSSVWQTQAPNIWFVGRMWCICTLFVLVSSMPYALPNACTQTHVREIMRTETPFKLWQSNAHTFIHNRKSHKIKYTNTLRFTSNYAATAAAATQSNQSTHTHSHSYPSDLGQQLSH